MAIKKRLKFADGTKAPTITKVIDENLGWNKSVLIDWYYNQMRLGKDPKKLNAEAKKIGSFCHEIVEMHVNKTKITDEYIDNLTVEQLILMDNIRDNLPRFEVTQLEVSFVSEKYRFGGRIDLLNWHLELSPKLRGTHTLYEIKTSKDIYADNIIQLGAQDLLLKDNGIYVDEFKIISIDKNMTTKEIVKVHSIPNDLVKMGGEVFLKLLDIHNAREKLEFKKEEETTIQKENE